MPEKDISKFANFSLIKYLSFSLSYLFFCLNVEV